MFRTPSAGQEQALEQTGDGSAPWWIQKAGGLNHTNPATHYRNPDQAPGSKHPATDHCIPIFSPYTGFVTSWPLCDVTDVTPTAYRFWASVYDAGPQSTRSRAGVRVNVRTHRSSSLPTRASLSAGCGSVRMLNKSASRSFVGGHVRENTVKLASANRIMALSERVWTNWRILLRMQEGCAVNWTPSIVGLFIRRKN